MQRRSAAVVAVFALLAALVLGACGASGGDEDSKDTTTTSAASDGGDDTTTTADDNGGEDETTTTTEDDGGDDPEPSGDEAAYVEAMIASMKDDEDFPLSDDQAECFSSRFIDTIGVDRLQDAGISPDDMASDDSSMDFSDLGLSMDEGNEIYDHFGDCDIDLRAEMMKSLGEDADVSPEAKACLENLFTDETLRKFMVISMVKGEDAAEEDPELAEFVGGLMACAFMGMDTGTTGG